MNAVQIATSDGYQLSGFRYSASGTARGAIVVAGATGVHQKFYRRFALFASCHGFDVLTFDYRGIGQSRPESLKGFKASYTDWAVLDLAAAIDVYSGEAVPIFLVGHSFGGQAITLLPNLQRLTAAYAFGAGTGWAGWMSPMEAIKVRLLWGVILPLIVRLKGYMAWRFLGMGGEDLPLGIYKDWKRWCSSPNGLFEIPEIRRLSESCISRSLTCVFATAVDDRWAPPRSRDVFTSFFNEATIVRKDIEASPRLPKVGHMGYFRNGAQDIWKQVFDFFDSIMSLDDLDSQQSNRIATYVTDPSK